ncbi:MAG: PKD domain-containing protein, partial [Bacteroidota bacterium]|nr:PKD domain-containing protein [Bacteroidota bacterium]
TYTVCTDTLIKTITVLPAPVIDFITSDTGKCQPPFTVNFSNNSNSASYVWNFGDSTSSNQTNPSHTYTRFGDFDVTLIATGNNGCSDTLLKSAYIKIHKPIITFPGLPTNGCIPYPVNFSATIISPDPVTSYKWDFGDGVGTSTLAAPSYTYPVFGTYAVTLTITTKGGCTETYTLPNAVKVGTPPTPAFTSDVTNACADPGIQFINQTVDPTGKYTYLWTFSDGTTSTEISPRHTFIDTGWIDVTLTAINNGCENKIIKNNYAYIKPSVSRFDYLPDCNNMLQYTFTDKSILATTWNWNFGDGTTFAGPNPPLHIFPAAGTYNVSLTTTNGSCTYTLTRVINIVDQTPDFIADIRSGCKPLGYIQFHALPPDPGLIKEYVWDLGNGPVTMPDPNPFVYTLYSNAGNYNITLTTIDTFGCTHSITKNNFIIVNGPLAKFGSNNNGGCKGMVVNFIDSTITDGINNIVNWKWYFGDGTSQSYTSPPFQHTYDSIGNYDVKLVVVDAKGCTDSITYREFVKVSTLKADWATGGATCPNAPLYFENRTTSDLPYSSLWDFGDGQTSTAVSLNHVYTDTGFYTVKLKVRDILGCEDSLIKTNVVQVSYPKASFTANNFTTYCTPFQATFTNTSTFYQSSYWDLSLATSTQQNPSLYYTNTGTYPIKLVVTSAGGCKDSITQTLRVFDPSNGVLNYSPFN